MNNIAKKPDQFPSPMLLFGCGNMAGAMVDGWMASGISGDNFHITKPSDRNLPNGTIYLGTPDKVSQKYDCLLIGVKPQMLPNVAEDINALLAPNALVISILSGVGSNSLSRLFPGTRILRLMPNLAVALGKSPLGLFSNDLSESEKSNVTEFVAPLGTPHWMQAEEDMHAFTAIAGCAPAYLYRFIDALAKAGEALGIDADIAVKLATEMTEGAAQLAAANPLPPADLAAKVASKGGSTAAGLAVLDKDESIMRLMKETLTAARDRSIEQGKEAE